MTYYINVYVLCIHISWGKTEDTYVLICRERRASILYFSLFPFSIRDIEKGRDSSILFYS